VIPGSSNCDLSGAGILVTRAAHQAGPLCDLIRTHHGRPLRFPAIEITGPKDPKLAEKLLGAVGDFDMVLFISPNAVSRSVRLLPVGGIPPDVKIAAVGRGTANCLAEAGISVDLIPEGRFDSEALLDSPALRAPEGKRFLIVRGEGGRALLGDTLSERGATVSYAEVYRRRCPTGDVSQLLQTWNRDVDLVTATSGEILENLFHLLGPEGTGRLRRTPLVVISERMRGRAGELGCRKVGVARRADDLAVFEAICGMLGKIG
jgi:uroporphyrinogen-III synthase